MKVVFIHPSHPNQFTLIAHTLAEQKGWECAVLVNEVFAEQIRRDNPPIPYYGFREETAPASESFYTHILEEGTRRGKAVVEALAHIKATVGVDVVVGHASFGTTFFIRELLKIPVISYVELPGYFSIYCRKEFPALYPQTLIDVCLRALIHSSVIQSDLCIVPSQYAKQLFHRELSHKIRVQGEGFLLPPPVRDKTVLRRNLGIIGAGPVVGFAGRTLEAVRGFDTFVKVAAKIRQVRNDVTFLVIGDDNTLYGNEMMYLGGKSFKQHALDTEGMEEGDFIFKPCMPHSLFVRHLQAMDLILYPIFEGAANWGLFEAMASGVPILASTRSFVPEVINHGQEGLLFDPQDVERFSCAALDILAKPDRFRYLGLNARRRISRQFSLKKAVDGYASIIREVAEANKRVSRLSRSSGSNNDVCKEAIWDTKKK